MVDFLIIRNNCDSATQITNWVGDGMKTYLEGKGFKVTDLSGDDANPDKVEKWLDICLGLNTVKAAICLDHGSEDAFWGQENGKLTKVLDKGNVQRRTTLLHVYTLACLTNADGGVGQKAVDGKCFSWLGYTDVAYVTQTQSFKDCIWSYMEYMADGKTMEECYQALEDAYKARTSESWIYQYNLDLLKLRKSGSNLTINNANRQTHTGAGYAARLDIEYFFEGSQHCIWAVVEGKSYYRWANDREVEDILHLTSEASKVWVQYDGSGKITRIRPVK
jgi:hypothetical protein